jgi:hypothetical protein
MLHLGGANQPKTLQCQRRFFSLFTRRYRYTKLKGERDFRLLAVFKDCKGNLIGTLIPTPLDKAPDYTAISYTWGYGVRTHSLTIDGRKLRITKNAYEILNYYASSGKRILLWIDTVGIDQNDRSDQSHQIRLMRDIYNKAALVVIWLGSPSKPSPVQLLINYISKDMFNYLSTSTSRNDRINNAITEKPEILPELLCHSYWSRVWVVQEIVAARKAVVFYNGEEYHWNKVVYAADSLHTHQERTFLRKIVQLEGLNIPDLTGLEKVTQIEKMRLHYGKEGYKEETFLPMILMKFFSSQATIKIDRIFAFLGISCAAEDRELQLNYEELDVKIFKEVARHSLRTKLPKLRFLYLSAAGLANNSNANWPSWVPDLRCLKTRLPFPLWDFGQYNAGGNTYSEIDFLRSDQISVEGVFIDKIRSVSKTKSKLNTNMYAQLKEKGHSTADATILEFCETELRRYKKFWKMVKEWKKPKSKGEEARYGPTGQTLKEAFIRTLLCDASFDFIGSETCTRSYSKEWLDFINADDGRLEIGNSGLTRISTRGQNGIRGYQSIQIEIDYSSGTLRDLTKLPLRMALSSFGRQFAVTEHGHMALVVPGVKVGDEICVFSGAATPHALRRSEGDKLRELYRLVGDAYIHGFMDGNWFEKQWKQHIIIQ